MIPNVKIIILNWNGGDVLLECLQSVSEIEYDNFDIIVIDNKSTDESIKNIHNQFPNVEVIALNQNYGYAKAHNKAFELINCNENSFFMLLNNDTIVDKYIIMNFVKNAEIEKSKGNDKYILGAKIYYLTESRKSKDNYGKSDIIWYNGGKVNLENGIIEHIRKDCENLEISPKSDCYITGCCIFAPVKVFRDLNGFDDIFYMYCEDVDFSLRAINKDIKLKVVPESILWHRVSYSLGSEFNYKKAIFKLSSLLKLYNKHVKWYIRYFSLLLLLLRMLISRLKVLI